MERPMAVSPSRKELIASAKSACANFGSRFIRAIIVSLWSRVVIILFLCLFVPPPAFHGGGNVGVLAAFAPAAKQNDDRLAFASAIDAVARSKIHLHFKDAFLQSFGRSEVACFKPPN